MRRRFFLFFYSLLLFCSGCKEKVTLDAFKIDSCFEETFWASLDYDCTLPIINLGNQSLPKLRTYLKQLPLNYSITGFTKIYLELPLNNSSFRIPVFVYSGTNSLMCSLVSRKKLIIKAHGVVVYDNKPIVDTSHLITVLNSTLTTADPLSGMRANLGVDWNDSVSNETLLPYFYAINKAYINASREMLYRRNGSKSLCSLRKVSKEVLLDEFRFNLTIFDEAIPPIPPPPPPPPNSY